MVATNAIQEQIPYTLQHHLDHVMNCQCVHKIYALIMLEKWTYKTTHFLIKQALGHQKTSKLFSSIKIYSTVSGNVLETFKNQNKLKDNISITLWATTAKLGQALCQVDTPLLPVTHERIEAQRQQVSICRNLIHHLQCQAFRVLYNLWKGLKKGSQVSSINNPVISCYIYL